MKKGINVVQYNIRLRTFLLKWDNYFFAVATIISFLIGSWVSGIIIMSFLAIAMYLSHKNAKYYLYDIVKSDETNIVEIHFFEKELNRKLNLDLRGIKVDFIDDGYGNHLRFYYNSELLLKQYAIGYWTRENLSKFYNNYCKGRFDMA